MAVDSWWLLYILDLQVHLIDLDEARIDHNAQNKRHQCEYDPLQYALLFLDLDAFPLDDGRVTRLVCHQSVVFEENGFSEALLLRCLMRYFVIEEEKDVHRCD